MATKDFPSNIVPDAEDWTLQFNSQVFTADLNGAIQTASLPGARWSANMTFSNRQGKDARALQAFLASLEGMFGRVYITPSDWEPYGSPSGAPTVDISQGTGFSTLQTTGWTASITDLLVAGDYFEIHGELKKVISNVSSDGVGNASIEFTPPLRVAASVGEAIRFTEPRCVMMLQKDDQAKWSISSPIIYTTTLSFVESLDI